MTTFYLVRHADKDLDGAVLPGRTPGVSLSAAGRRQAEALARHLGDRGVRCVYSSPLARARETAAPLARRCNLKVEPEEAFGEIDYGDWTNEAIRDLESDAHWQRFHAFRSGVPIPGGERLLDVQARFAGAMLRLRTAWPEGAVAIFSHGDPIRLALAYFAGMPLDMFDRLEVRPASVSTVVVGDYGPTIGGLNALPGHPSVRARQGGEARERGQANE